jgi:[lysine-biosynthesis-protein LysW]--L-2-aminoadipate ligase
MTAALALLASRIRAEEKWLMAALDQRGIAFDTIDPRRMTFRYDRSGPADRPAYRLAVSREISHHRALYAARLLEHAGVPVVNPAHALAVCGDKLQTTLALRAAGVPTPRGLVALTTDAALAALDEFGYPCVIKPLVGSWGRLVARLDGPEAARAVLEHRAALPNPQHAITYVQEYVDKPGRDIRGLVAGDEVVGAVYRVAADWRTNTARTATTRPCPVGAELDRLLRAAATAVGPGFYGIDVLEDRDGRLYVNEINHTPEFHGAAEVLGADVAGRYVDYVLGWLPPD